MKNKVKGEEKIIGVYKILNKVNNKLYVGSSTFVQSRLRLHKSHLRKNEHVNKHLQSSFNKYGIENFQFLLIEECEESNLIEREQYWIDLLDTCNKDKGYNKRSKAESNFGLKRSLETRKRISEAKKGKKFLSDEHYQKLADQKRGISNEAAIVYQASLTSEQKTFNALRALEGRRKKEIERGSFNTPEGQLSYKKKRGHVVYQYDINYNLVKTHLTISDALKEIGMSVKNTSCIKNQLDTDKIYKGFIWTSVERVNSNVNNASGELLGSLEVDNQQPS